MTLHAHCIAFNGFSSGKAKLGRSGFLFLALTDAGSLVLREAGRALAGESSNGVNTEELAVVLLCRALIQIFQKQRRRNKCRTKMILKAFITAPVTQGDAVFLQM